MCGHRQSSHGLLTAPLTSAGEVVKPVNWAALAVREAKEILGLALPMVLTGLLLYSRSMISMLFLGRLGDLSLAGGALAVGFANITGYSVLAGLAAGMEPLCGQAFGARRLGLLSLALHRTVLLLLCAAAPISLLWLYIRPVLLLLGQDPALAAAAATYLRASLPDLIIHSFLHPLRVYLRAQSVTLPLTACAGLSLVLHLPVNYLFVSVLGLGLSGVAYASVLTNLNLVAFLCFYIYFSGHLRGLLCFSGECFRGWNTLLCLAVPSCASVCLEWWWYEIMIILCGLLVDSRAAVASMGVLIQTTSLLYVLPSSLSFAASTRVANELGANRPDRARLAATVGLSCGAAVGVGSLCFAVAVRRSWAGMFTSDPGVLALTSAALPLLGLCELGNCPQTAGCGVLRGSARPRAGANINLGAFYCVGMPAAVGLAFFAGFGFVGLWLGLLAAQATCAALMLAVVGVTDWDAQADRAQQLTGGAIADCDEEKGAAPKDSVVDRDEALLIKIEQQQQIVTC